MSETRTRALVAVSEALLRRRVGPFVSLANAETQLTAYEDARAVLEQLVEDGLLPPEALP